MRHAWRARVVTREAVDRRPGRTPLVATTRATKLRPRSRAALSCATVGGDSYSSVRRRGGRNGRRCRRRCRGPRRRRNDGAGYVMWGRSCHGALVTSWVWRRRHERGAEALLHHCSCVAVVMRGTGGRRAGGGRVGANGARSGGPRLGTRAVYCASSRAVGADRGPTPTWRR